MAIRFMAFLSSSLLFTSSVAAFSAECGMVPSDKHVGEKATTIYSANNGYASLYYSADMDVNTDGTARSYHPDDPLGESIAFNNIGNGIKRIFDKNGTDITCKRRTGKCFKKFISTFKAARDSKYNPNGNPRFTSTGMIPWKYNAALGRETPCITNSGPFKGYFVSQTSLSVNPNLDQCDQARYLDSFTYNAVVLPLGAKWSAQGTVTDDGDLVVVRDIESRKLFFAINGDRGPESKVGEGTIALTAALSGTTLTGTETYKEIKELARKNVQYVTFPKDDIRRLVAGGFTQTDIDREGKKLFDAWGGTARLDACEALVR